MKRILVVLSLLISISGCLPSLRVSESEYKIFNLTQELAVSRDKDFFIYLPHRWFTTKDINYDANEIWIVHENYSAVIVLKKINLNGELKSSNNLETLLELAKVDALLYKRKNGSSFKIVSNPQLYRNGNLSYSSFEFKLSESSFTRVVIIEKNGNYFECIAYSTEKGHGKISLIELYSIQESVIASLNVR